MQIESRYGDTCEEHISFFHRVLLKNSRRSDASGDGKIKSPPPMDTLYLSCTINQYEDEEALASKSGVHGFQVQLRQYASARLGPSSKIKVFHYHDGLCKNQPSLLSRACQEAKGPLAIEMRKTDLYRGPLRMLVVGTYY